MARTRSVTDAVLLEAAMAVMSRAGADGVTFAAVSAATGLAPATLVQRFGSKQGLVKAALRHAWDQLDAATEAAAAATPATAEGAVAFLIRLSGDYPEQDEAYADQLLVLREDLRDPEFRARGSAWGARLRAVLAPRLADATGPREDLAREMITLWQGAVLWWAFERDGAIIDHVRATLLRWLDRISHDRGI
ncbi:helix-turn-helix domain containing protein [Kaistia dalseonensis]|uniref:AcrR family transcriptional regulator n=1 Tax=Kaistia dalseonensis TaxID=410840 RepID=A0ABU0H6C1_9HYPH|nr:helix-turn-helix domain-containing protein [Kaistia dalseonensis]MCX5495266.1 helix-turn-helix domain containing protein [Kaistia dalseonensis]MDQ0437852.1 AcrR family transcriptional regulator [Kaistia dalseonensis]